MTGLFKCVVLSCAVSLVFGYMSVRDDANWFKNGERIKNRFVTGVVNGIVNFNCDDTINGAQVEGECLSKVECTKSEGKLGGLCSLLGSCCVIERTCSQTTSSKLSYFVPPKALKSEVCPLTINVYSKNVCQIRLDFDEFHIAPPTNQSKNLSYQCHDDSFKVENVKNLGFIHLCGKNKGQHIYIPVAENQQQVKISFNFKNRTGTNLSPPIWRIKIRQLECGKMGYEHPLNAPTKLMAMYNNLKNKKNHKSDYEWKAPTRCLQYYPQKKGTFESFNYDDGKGHYIGYLDYAICFKKDHEICAARYTSAGLFQMNYNKYDPSESKTDPYAKCYPRIPSDSKVSLDYIRIPGGVDSGNSRRDYYCNRDFDNNNTVTVQLFEPLYVGVHTDGYQPNSEDENADDYQEIGFRIGYELFSGNCDIRF